MSALVDFLKIYEFFSSRSKQDIFDIAICLLLEEFEKDEMIFDQGDYGDKFYVILKGSVGVDISVKQKVEEEELAERKI